ncbi:hypothetical protein HJB86_21370 [Rhizobium sp. NZLR3b]|uniref:hypothetical protein n=1 Tax=Rhizobium sp. NZLR3b TaxID=2731101 RepID=UPI001C83A3BF|nr:hypothetical protein [Rhizobium sp. NZLR3b]MBX5191434.1 hypothetical protein [Rhizobium sp. NZLR3b]
MEIQSYNIYISATQAGVHRNGKVHAGYALRILGNGVDKELHAGGQQREVQVMYAIGLNEAYQFLWSEMEDNGSDSKPPVEIVVESANMGVRFRNAEESFFEKTFTGETKAKDNVDVWLENIARATHFQTQFREPVDAEKPILKRLKQLAKAAAQKSASGRGGVGE